MRLRAVMISAVILASASAWAASPPQPPPDQVQEYQIASYRMTVPVGYLSLAEEKFQGKPDDTIRQKVTHGNRTLLVMEYPRFGHPTAHKRHYDYRVQAQYDLFDINLNPFPGGTRNAWSHFMEELRAAGDCDATNAFDRCPDPHWKDYTQSESFYLGNDHDFVVCRIKGSVPVPHCEIQQMLIDEIIISIRFHRRYLDDVLKIRDGVFARVCSWLHLPAGRTYTVNHCR